MLAIRCWLFDVGCSMLVVRCWLFDVGCSMLVVRCWLFDVGCSMLVVRCWLFDVSRFGCNNRRDLEKNRQNSFLAHSMASDSEKCPECPVCGSPKSGWLDDNCPTCLMQLGTPIQQGNRALAE